MKILISGSSGLVGSALIPHLESDGHKVVRLVRKLGARGEAELPWDPQTGSLDPEFLSGADVVINLNGRSIGQDRWSPQVKDALRESRLDSTRTLTRAIAAAANPPALLLNASATGYYGDRGEERLEESSAAGKGFLSDLTRDWEAAALEARSANTRVVLLRLGMVIAAGGALDKMLLPFKLGLGGPMGTGRQFWPWIALDDVLGAIDRAIENSDLDGPINLVSPQETRCAEFAKTLGRVLGRPAFMPLPAFAARIALGEMADALLLSSQRVEPKALVEADYQFKTPTLDQAIQNALN